MWKDLRCLNVDCHGFKEGLDLERLVISDALSQQCQMDTSRVALLLIAFKDKAISINFHTGGDGPVCCVSSVDIDSQTIRACSTAVSASACVASCQSPG